MSETKFVTLEGLKKFKDLLDNTYSEKFASKEQSAGEPGVGDNEFATDEEVEHMLDDIFSGNSVPDSPSPSDESNIEFATDEEVKNLLDGIFG